MTRPASRTTTRSHARITRSMWCSTRTTVIRRDSLRTSPPSSAASSRTGQSASSSSNRSWGLATRALARAARLRTKWLTVAGGSSAYFAMPSSRNSAGPVESSLLVAGHADQDPDGARRRRRPPTPTRPRPPRRRPLRPLPRRRLDPHPAPSAASAAPGRWRLGGDRVRGGPDRRALPVGRRGSGQVGLLRADHALLAGRRRLVAALLSGSVRRLHTDHRQPAPAG